MNDWWDYLYDQHTLMHFGTPRRSGRYPWGSGKDPYQSIERSKHKYFEGQRSFNKHYNEALDKW